MPLTNAGRDFIASAITGAGIAFNSANSYIGVGSATTAFNVAQTNLQATTEKLRKAMVPGYPVVAGNAITFKASFGPSDANWAWQEWAIFNDPAAGTMLNRTLEDNGVKIDGQTWVFEATVTVTVGA